MDFKAKKAEEAARSMEHHLWKPEWKRLPPGLREFWWYKTSMGYLTPLCIDTPMAGSPRSQSWCLHNVFDKLQVSACLHTAGNLETWNLLPWPQPFEGITVDLILKNGDFLFTSSSNSIYHWALMNKHSQPSGLPHRPPQIYLSRGQKVEIKS